MLVSVLSDNLGMVATGRTMVAGFATAGTGLCAGTECPVMLRCSGTVCGTVDDTVCLPSESVFALFLGTSSSAECLTLCSTTSE